MNDSKSLLESLRGETNIKHKTIDNKQKTLTTNMVSNPPLRGKGLSAEVDLCEGPVGPEGKPSKDRAFLSEKVLGIGSTKPKPLTLGEISYAALTLYKPNPKKPNAPGRRVNLDFRVNDSTTFNKLVFALTQKDSDFYGNLPDDWQQMDYYQQPFEFYREIKQLKIEAWIGKGCIRQKYIKGKSIKSKMRLGTAMVIYKHQGIMQGRCWLESSVFDFEFDQLMQDNDLYLAKSEPFEPQVVWDQSPWQ
jgi:hypothetical protein